MPKGLPSTEDLNSKIKAFTLDTSVIEATGFRFNEGALRSLARQLPPWLQLWMTDIVSREVMGHRIEHVEKAMGQIRGGAQELKRHVGDQVRGIDVGWLDRAKNDAIDLFDSQFRAFIAAHQGVILDPDHPALARRVFDMYFGGHPPFGGGRDKKHEFPDAFALATLEQEAQSKDGLVIAVSKDDGWKAYAASSPRIYCIQSLSDLTALYLSDSVAAKTVRDRIAKYFGTPSPELTSQIREIVNRGISRIPWRVAKFRGYHFDIETDVLDVVLDNFSVVPDAVGVWITSSSNTACVAEMIVELDLSMRLKATAYKDDFIEHDTVLADEQLIISHAHEAKLSIELSGSILSNAIESTFTKLELRDDVVVISLNRRDLGAMLDKIGSPLTYDFGDDIPF